MKIASIQLNAKFADVVSNLEQCENYIRQVVSARICGGRNLREYFLPKCRASFSR